MKTCLKNALIVFLLIPGHLVLYSMNGNAASDSESAANAVPDIATLHAESLKKPKGMAIPVISG